MTNLFDEQGNAVEGALTPEEVVAKLAEKEEETNKTIEEVQTAQQEELQTLQQQLTEAKQETEKLKGKDLNFSGLRKQKEEANAKVEALEKKMDEFKEVFVSQINQLNAGQVEKKIQEKALAIASGDSEMAKKISFFYKQFGGEPKDDKEFEERMKNAELLASGGRSAIPANVYGSGGGSVSMTGGNEPTKWTDDQKDLGKKLGISDADISKYSGKMPKYTGDRTSNKAWLNQ